MKSNEQPGSDRSNPTSSALETTIDDFLNSGRKSGNYRDALKRVLTDWRTFVEDSGVTSIAEVDKKVMKRYASDLADDVDEGQNRNTDNGISAATARTYYDYVSALLDYCVRTDDIEENPALKELATDELPPRPSKKSGDQQFWKAEHRDGITAFSDRRAHDAVDEEGMDALEELRDRALVYVFAYSGARGGELLSDPRDDRRDGVRWGDVDLENNQLTVLGKNQQPDDEVILPEQCHGPLRRLKRALDPVNDDWPVFVTLHAPTLYKDLSDDVDTSAGEPLELYREHGQVPRSLSTNGGRRVLKQLSKAAGITIDGEYLKPHGARRGVGEAFYDEHGPSAAQRALRHANPRTTSQMYAHKETSELAEEGAEVFEKE